MEVDNLRRGSGAGLGLLVVVLGLVLTLGPNLIPTNSPVQLPGISKFILMIFGVLCLLVGGVFVVLTKLYVRTTADTAFVRTGVGGPKAIIDGGAIVAAPFHTMTPVTLQSMKLNIDRRGENSLRTADYLRTNVKAEIYLKVKKDVDSVKAAAATLGDKANNPNAIQQFVEQKLDAALRAVVAQLELEALNSNREKLQSGAREIAAHDLQHNGLEVESFVITYIEQTPSNDLRPNDDIFDAAGAKVIAEKTSLARIKRNEIEQDTQRQVTEKQVNTAKELLELNLQKETQEADNEAKVRKAKAFAEAEAAKVEAEQRKVAEAARIDTQKTVQTAEIESERELAVKRQDRERDEQTARIAREEAEELADREKQIAIAEAERRKAESEKARITAETEREVEQQRQLTVAKTAEAERLATTQTIDVKARAEQQKITAVTAAEADAETRVRMAEADARSAEKQAEAKTRLAQADQQAVILQAEGEKQAKVLSAEGLKAEGMVPVEVEAKRVEVKRAEVEVEIKRMEAQAANQEISVELQTTLARITANKEAQVAFAAALGQALSGADMKIFGDPSTFLRMSEAFTRGQSFGALIEGAVEGTPEEVQQAAYAGLAGLGQVGAAIVEKLTGKKVKPEDVEQAIADLQKSQ